MKPGVTVVTPAVPPRAAVVLPQAIDSVARQTHQAEAHVIVLDHAGEGEAVTRNRGLFAVDTEWTAFLDDDDTLYPFHLQSLLMHQETTGADLVFPWFDVEGGTDPLGRFGMPFDPDELRRNNYIPVTYLVRTELAQGVGGFPDPDGGVYPSPTACVDWAFLLRLLDAGASFAHLPERTWRWRHWSDGKGGGNLSGRRWTDVS